MHHRDVEKTMKDFGAYFKTLKERDSVVTHGLVSMGKFMDNLLAINPHDKEIKQLKSSHDQLFIKGIQFAAVTGNRDALNILFRSVISKDEYPRDIQDIRIGSEYSVNSKADASKGKILSYNGNTLKFSVFW